MKRLRRMIETTFAQAKDVFSLEKPRDHSWWGVFGSPIAKLTGLALDARLNKRQGCSPLALAHFSSDLNSHSA